VGHSTAKNQRKKPLKPYPDFPLFPHASGVWAKKIKGEMKYFGKWDDPDAAYKKFKDFVEGKSSDGTTIRELANAFLRTKEAAMDNGELSPRSFRDYFRTCSALVEFFGKPQLIDEIRAEDFGRYRVHLAKRRNFVSLGNEINRVRIVFRYAVDNDLMAKSPKYGQEFERPSRKTLRKAKAEKGRQIFEAAELRAVIEKASPTMLAMIYLGINCALGQSDLASLPISALDLKGGWLNFARQKTGIQRRIPLWKETVAALKVAIEERPKPKSKDHGGLVFITRLGHPWVRIKRNVRDEIVEIDSVLQEFQKLLDTLPNVPRLGFYSLRHLHRTISDGAKDQPASIAIMGHAPESNDMSAVYRHGVSDDRLRAVTDFVRKWLFPPKRAAK
jgi:integrase